MREADDREVPGWRALPLARRARARALMWLADRIAHGARAPLTSARDRAPEPLQRAVARALAPLRLSAPSLASVPLSAPMPAPVAMAAGAPRATVIVPTRGARTLPQCLAAIAAFTPIPHEVVVVTDGVTARDALKAPAPGARARVIERAARRGFAAACNAGAALAESEVLVFLNDDAVVTPGWLEALLEALARPRAGLAGPGSNDTGDAATRPVRYEDLQGLLTAARAGTGAPRAVEKLSLFCAAIPRALFESIGGLDEGYGLGGFEDDELSMAVRRRGREVLLVPSAFVHHHGSVTFEAMPARERIARFEINRHRFERRWRLRWRAPF